MIFGPKTKAPVDEIDWGLTAAGVVAVGLFLVFAIGCALAIRWWLRQEAEHNAKRAREDEQTRARVTYETAQRQAWEQAAASQRMAMEEEARRRHEESLVQRFGAEDARRILRHEIWVGQTEHQLRLSRGDPADIDERVMKTKTKLVYKYHHQGGAKYGMRIMLDDGIVVGWDDKR